MEKTAYAILGTVAVLWLGAMIAGMVVAIPVGLIGLVVLAGFGLLVAKVVGERLVNEEDNYYDKNIHQ